MTWLPVVEAQGWCFLVMLSLVGWGGLVLQFVLRRTESIGLAACVGTAVALIAGGLLNLLQLVTMPAVLLFVLAGWAALALTATQRWNIGAVAEFDVLQIWTRQAWKFKHVMLAILVLLFLFRLVSTTRVLGYVSQDDDNFYLAMPVKMMQTGHLAADPFSERRVESSLGGSYFLQCLLTAVLPLDHIQMMDRTIGFVLLLAVALALLGRFAVSPLAAVRVLVLAILLVPFEFNLTFTVLPSALILAMALLLLRPGDSHAIQAGTAFLLGLLTGALCVMKSVNLPFTALVCLLAGFSLRGGQGWKGTAQVWGWILLGITPVMAPWMIAMRMTSGTFFYPLLGPGDDFSAYHQFPMPFRVNPATLVHDSIVYYLPLAAIAVCQYLQFPRRESKILLGLTAACLLSSVATGIVTGGDDNFRYCFPVVLSALVAGLVDFASAWPAGTTALVTLRAGVVAALLIWIGLHAIRGQYGLMGRDLRAAFANPEMDTVQTKQEYAAINAALPKGVPVLTTLQKAYLLSPLDETRLLADYPGCASLPPGWPIRENGEVLAQYLLAHSIRYLAYTYRDNAQLASCQLALPNLSHRSVRTQIQFGSYLLADQQYRELRQSRRVLFDDGTVFILDLAEHADAAPQP